MVAGGYGSNPEPQRYNHRSRPDRLTDPTKLTSVGITIPEWTWRAALVLDQMNQGPNDVTATTVTYAILTPNRVEPDHAPTNSDGSVERDADFANPELHPFNQLLGSNRPAIVNKAEWRNWNTWRLTVDEIEALTKLDLFRNIPQNVQDQIEQTLSPVLSTSSVPPTSALLAATDSASESLGISSDAAIWHSRVTEKPILTHTTTKFGTRQVGVGEISTTHNNNVTESGRTLSGFEGGGGEGLAEFTVVEGGGVDEPA